MSANILEEYIRTAPSAEAAFRLFDGQWSSNIPGFGFGGAELFNDHRVRWWEDRIGGFFGKRVLELGPLEAGHTCMMAQRGAASILSIESNTRAYMKCLIVQNALKFRADFVLGDFRPYLAASPAKFDFLLASGVLYHMTDPVSLLRDATRAADTIGIWTHYFDGAVISANPQLSAKFDWTPKHVELGGRQIVTHRQSYLQALEWGGFCGGADDHSYWLTLDSIRNVFDVCGFDVEIGQDEPNHPNGPCVTFLARRR